jgi:hypothetical protein
MSIEYPKCDNFNCWYGHNTDRLNDYEQSYPLIINTCPYLYKTYDTEGKLPYTIQLCDVCRDNQYLGCEIDCALCNKTMFDEWVLIDNKHYCRHCLHEDMWEDFMTEEDGNRLSTISDEKIAEATHKETAKHNKLIISLMKKVIVHIIEEKKKRKEAKLKQRYENDMKKTNLSKKYIPELSDEMIVQLIRKTNPISQEIENADEFIEWLITNIIQPKSL